MKTLYIIAGANGSGKTTFAMIYQKIKGVKFINADEIAKEYAPDDIEKFKLKTGKIFFSEIKKSLDENKSFIIETTLSGKYLINFINKAKNKGFKVSLIYLYLDNIEEHILRVKHRVLNGGHNIPVEDIIRRYKRSRYNFLNIYRSIVDEWSIFYNADCNFELIANNIEILDETLYYRFIVEDNYE